MEMQERYAPLPIGSKNGRQLQQHHRLAVNWQLQDGWNWVLPRRRSTTPLMERHLQRAPISIRSRSWSIRRPPCRQLLYPKTEKSVKWPPSSIQRQPEQLCRKPLMRAAPLWIQERLLRCGQIRPMHRSTIPPMERIRHLIIWAVFWNTQKKELWSAAQLR